MTDDLLLRTINLRERPTEIAREDQWIVAEPSPATRRLQHIALCLPATYELARLRHERRHADITTAPICLPMQLGQQSSVVRLVEDATSQSGTRRPTLAAHA